MRRRLGMIASGALVVALQAAIVLLLPILLPAALASEAWTMRRLAGTRCIACGAAIGLVEIRRAKLEARAKARAIIDSMLAVGHRPRVVVTWDVTCATCGQQYEYHPDQGPRRLLAAKDQGSPAAQG